MPRDSSLQAQAILRAIENEAQVRRQRIEAQRLRGLATGPGPAPVAQPPSDLRGAADRLMALVDHVVSQTDGVRARVREVERSLELLQAELAVPQPAPAAQGAPRSEEPPVPAAAAPDLQPEPQPTAAPALIAEPGPAVAPAPPTEEEVVDVQPADLAPSPREPQVEAALDPVLASEPVAEHSEFDGARLMAIEMAVSGSSRGEVGERLTQDFHIADPAPILDDVFGEGSPESSRMPWTY